MTENKGYYLRIRRRRRRQIYKNTPYYKNTPLIDCRNLLRGVFLTNTRWRGGKKAPLRTPVFRQENHTKIEDFQKMLGIFFQIFLKNHQFRRFLLKNMESFLEIFEARRHPNEIGKQRPRSLQKWPKTKNIDLRFLHFLFIFDDFCRYLLTRCSALRWAISAQFSHFWTRNLWFWVRSKHKLFVFFWFSESLIFMLCFCKIHDFAFIIDGQWTENSTLFIVFN